MYTRTHAYACMDICRGVLLACFHLLGTRSISYSYLVPSRETSWTRRIRLGGKSVGW